MLRIQFQREDSFSRSKTLLNHRRHEWRSSEVEAASSFLPMHCPSSPPSSSLPPSPTPAAPRLSPLPNGTQGVKCVWWVAVCMFSCVCPRIPSGRCGHTLTLALAGSHTQPHPRHLRPQGLRACEGEGDAALHTRQEGGPGSGPTRASTFPLL